MQLTGASLTDLLNRNPHLAWSGAPFRIQSFARSHAFAIK